MSRVAGLGAHALFLSVSMSASFAQVGVAVFTLGIDPFPFLGSPTLSLSLAMTHTDLVLSGLGSYLIKKFNIYIYMG